MENAITDLLDALIPNLEKLVGNIRSWMGVAMLIGPVIFIVMGLVYYFLAPPEANHKLGYRTYFGMGSVQAWRFTQRLSGIVLGALGLILTGVMLVVSMGFGAMDVMDMVWLALKCLGIEAVLALVANLAIMIAAMIRFDRRGEIRKKNKKK